MGYLIKYQKKLANSRPKASNNMKFKNNESMVNNRFHPIISIFLGFIIALVCSDLLMIITGIVGSTSFGIINFVDGIIPLVIGAFVTTFFAKEKKIQYAIYFGIILTILGLLSSYQRHIHINTGLYIQIAVLIAVVLGYFFFAVIGGYFRNNGR